MNYYEHHIGDYAAATAHLSLVEDAIYSRLLRRYYLQEGPLPVDERQVARLAGARTDDELAAVSAVLAEFFTLEDDGYHQKRADADIAKYHEKQAGWQEERESETERKRRYRARRASLFAELREVGVVPPFDTPTEELVRLVSQSCPASPSRPCPTGQDGDGTATHTPDTSNQSLKAKAKAVASARGERLPTDWVLPAEWYGWAREHRPDVDARAEAEKFRDYWTAQPGAKGRKTDWLATWRNWIRGARASPHLTPPSAAPPSKTLTAIQKLQGMKHGQLAAQRDSGRPQQAALLESGADPGE
jgi:uncharacterized protein YdaU (DUF1376 family)